MFVGCRTRNLYLSDCILFFYNMLSLLLERARTKRSFTGSLYDSSDTLPAHTSSCARRSSGSAAQEDMKLIKLPIATGSMTAREDQCLNQNSGGVSLILFRRKKRITLIYIFDHGLLLWKLHKHGNHECPDVTSSV